MPSSRHLDEFQLTDLTHPSRVGAYIGLYYLFSTQGAILGPVLNGWIIQLSGKDYGLTMLVGPFFILLAPGINLRVRRGEAIVPGLPA